MKHLFALLALSLICLVTGAGCQTSPRPEDVTRSSLELPLGTNVVRISHPKDTKIGHLEFTSPRGERLTVDDYQSSANGAALDATARAAEANAATMREVVGLARDTAADARRAASLYFGLPAGNGATRSGSNPAAEVDGGGVRDASNSMATTPR